MHTRDTSSVIDVILPVLDEAEALPWVLERMPEGCEPLVVDNGSTDGSGEIARSLGARVVIEPTPGFGAACDSGLRAARGDLVCFMDCDASLDPRDLWRVVDPVIEGRVDLMLGRRVAEAGAWPVHARWGNRLISLGIGRRVGVALHDVGPMRAMRREAVLALGLRDRRFGWPFEMVLAAGAAGWRIAETPVPYLARTGTSKVTGTVVGTARAVRDLARVMRCT
ncbi:MAG: glycosyltransferase family 2 protein [Actinomycetota bacterium]|nr:glycosyltransferase family 2 protein [Actinomycetota bacterium]